MKVIERGAALRSFRPSPGAAAAGVAASLAAAAVFNALAAHRAERQYPPRGRLVECLGARLHLLDTGGPGAPVVLLHGNGATTADMEISGLVERLRSSHRVVVFDRPGYGYSTRRRGRDWTPEAQADLIAASLDRLGIAQAVVLGHSWGALVAAALALRHPSRVSKLILVAGYFFPTLRADAVLTSPYALPGLGDVLRETVAPLIARAVAKPMIERMFRPRPVPERFWREFPFGLAYRPQQLRASQEETAMMAPAAKRLMQSYRVISCPVTILVGAEDGMVDPERHSLALNRVIPQSRLHVLPGVGHMAHYAAADIVSRACAQAQPASPLRAAAGPLRHEMES